MTISRSLGISATGMQAQQMQLDVISNNLANVSNKGFKRSTAMFEDLMYQNLRQVGGNTSEQTELPTGLQIGLGVKVAGTARDFGEGTLEATSSPYDMAINGKGFFQIQMSDGSVAYTRDGTFHVNSATNQLVTKNGETVLGPVTIPSNASPGSITVDARGIVTYLVKGDPNPQTAGALQIANFINPAGLDPQGKNLFIETQASGAPITGTPGSDGLGEIWQSHLEGSNVNVVQELVAMIQTQRAYEMNSKAIQTSDQMLQRLSQL